MVYIKDKQHHFLKNVLRAKINDQINIFDGFSGEWETKIISINRDNTILRVTKNIRKIKESNDIWLIFSPIKLNGNLILLVNKWDIYSSVIILIYISIFYISILFLYFTYNSIFPR